MISSDQKSCCIDIMDQCLNARTNEDLEAIWLNLRSLCNINAMMLSVAESYEDDDIATTSVMRLFGLSDIWKEYYMSKNYALIDPVVKYCSVVNDKVFRWQEAYDHYDSEEVAAFISDAKEAGLSDGYSIGQTVHEITHTASIVSVSIDPNCVDESQHTLIHQLLPHVNSILYRPSFTPKPLLTQREREALTHAVRGGTYEEIAQAMNVTKATANFHVNSVVKKLNVRTREQAIKKATMLGMVGFQPKLKKPQPHQPKPLTFKELKAARLAEQKDKQGQ